MVNDSSYDLVVIGGGPGGYVAAIRAAQLGLKTAVVEREHMGGICLNWGCIPTKALLRSAEVLHLIEHADMFGISVKDVKVDFKAIIARSRKVSEQLASGIGHLMKKHKVEVIEGHGKLNGKHALAVMDGKKKVRDVSAKHIILATGARPRDVKGMEADGKLIWNYKHAMTPDVLPKSLLVVGSGAIGIEFASFYRALGVEVTVVEMLDRVLPNEDAEISALAHKAFEKHGIVIKAGTSVNALKAGKDSVKATLETNGKEETLTVDRVIMAVGVVANTENLALEGTKVAIEKGHIVTDEFGATDEPGIYAIGDVTAPPWLAHKASHEAVLCVEKIAGLDVTPMHRDAIPGCTYCHPQVASVGLTEEQAASQGISYRVGRFPFMGNGKAIALGEPEGLVKTIFDEHTGELLGAHMIGAEVTELIHSFVLGKTLEATEEDFIHTVFPHPTLSEMLHESVLDALDRALHI